VNACHVPSILLNALQVGKTTYLQANIVESLGLSVHNNGYSWVPLGALFTSYYISDSGPGLVSWQLLIIAVVVQAAQLNIDLRPGVGTARQPQQTEADKSLELQDEGDDVVWVLHIHVSVQPPSNTIVTWPCIRDTRP
jgi:hypothetical protein